MNTISTIDVRIVNGSGKGYDMEVAKVVLIGITLVFLILFLLTLLLGLFPKIFGQKQKKEINQIEPDEIQSGSIESKPDDLALISVLTAAVAAYRSSGENADTNNFKVVAFRKTPSKKIGGK